MRGIDPRIQTRRLLAGLRVWMAGSGPAMTAETVAPLSSALLPHSPERCSSFSGAREARTRDPSRRAAAGPRIAFRVRGCGALRGVMRGLDPRIQTRRLLAGLRVWVAGSGPGHDGGKGGASLFGVAPAFPGALLPHSPERCSHFPGAREARTRHPSRRAAARPPIAFGVRGCEAGLSRRALAS